jgi:tRNA pseudouridine32 synthase/23S rRNA pseudouridine746 synthase
MNKGAAWIKKKGKMQRLRKATALLHKGDHIELHYDEKLLALTPPEANLVSDLLHYSVWFKPAGLMAQGTMFGDHCSLLRQAEQYFGMQRPVFLVHRLDREADGLMLIAHSRVAAEKLSDLFQKKRITKEYRLSVMGDLGEEGTKGTIDQPLEGKEAVTDYEIISHGPERKTTVVSALIRTGRLHQIRRHFAMTGFPVMGDPKYGKGNKNREGMKLTAASLKFICPFSHRQVQFAVPQQQ